ncbi:hypothetical protein BJX66DRAFT_82811 [Aspergillus keveii]|uniref:Uncharacterized protein n=1 Tax=Aspergillus keveii TaxID=714993 RepID=A0ABR4GFG6_9EURO
MSLNRNQTVYSVVVCIPSSTFPPHRPHQRGPNEEETSYRGVFALQSRSTRRSKATHRREEGWTMVVAGSVDFLMRKEKKKETERKTEFARIYFHSVRHVVGPVLFRCGPQQQQRQRGSKAKRSGSKTETVTVAALYNF